jgi:hypothetical protein
LSLSVTGPFGGVGAVGTGVIFEGATQAA